MATTRSRATASSRATPETSATSQNGSTSVQNGNTKHAPTTSDKTSNAGTAAAIAHATVPAWLNITMMVGLIFGGCCANVFALEAIVKDDPSAGTLITFAQFLLCAVFTLPQILSFSAGPKNLFLATRSIPLTKWLIYTFFFMTINLLNNFAFSYRISVPLHIIIRSAGPVATMIVGYIYNKKRYTPVQVFAVVLLTVGVVTSALADARAHGKGIEIKSASSSLADFVIGTAILTLAMVLAAFQGVYADSLYEHYGRSHWKEALFYSHALSLPFLMVYFQNMTSQYQNLASSPPVMSALSLNKTADEQLTPSPFPIPAALVPVMHLVAPFLVRIPSKLFYLLLNAFTQYLCIRGVHLLSAQSSSLTTTIVLNIRKLVSLLLSIYLFGNKLSGGVMLGAVVVFVGGGVYGVEGARLGRIRREKAEKERKAKEGKTQ